MLSISKLSVRVAGRLLIENASAMLPAGTKAGLVGRNGAGKTTLFRVITGALSPETGTVSLPKNTRIGQVEQEAPGTEEPLIDIVLRADGERTRLMDEAATATDPHLIAEIQTRLTDIGAHSAEARAASILAGLGFDQAAQQRPAASFSGGWRMRVALAAVLFAEPDLLLLDEPTNYLDLEGTLWLEEYIRHYPHTVVIISHDRDLLNKAVGTIVHLDQRRLTLYRGGFDAFRRQKAEQDALREKARVKSEAQRKHMEAFVERFRYKASKARQAQSRLKALEKLETFEPVIEERVPPFRFPEPERAISSPIIAMEGVSAGYARGAPVLSGLDLRIDEDDRIALLGANGNGKSTFAKLIAGRMEPMAGRLNRAPHLSIGYFAQHQIDDLRPAESAVAHVRRLMPEAAEAKVRARVARMGLATEKMATPAGELSGGEKARLLMGLATFFSPNMIILDEPTNHLDVDSRAALIEALNDYEGAVILISHDRYLLEATADRLWLVAGGTVSSFDGDLADYRSIVVGGRAGRSDARTDGAGSDETPGLTRAELRKRAADRRRELAPLKKKINDLESLTARLQKRIQAIDAELADPAVYDRAARVTELGKERAACQKKLAEAEELWLELSSEYETAAAE